MTDHAASIPSLSDRLTVPLPKGAAELLMFWGELGLVVFGLVVAIGIIGEHISEKRRDKWMPAHLRPRGWNWPLIWLGFVAGGVALEFICDAAIWESSASLQAIADRDTVDLTTANVQLQLKVEEAKRLAGPRNIGEPSIRADMQAKLAPFAGTPYDLTIPFVVDRSPVPALLEPGSFLVEHLIYVLSVMSGWKLHSVVGTISKTPLPPSVVIVASLGSLPKNVPFLPKDVLTVLAGELNGVAGVKIILRSDTKQPAAAEELAHTLNAAGIWTEFEFLPPPNNNVPVDALTGDAVHIIIGTKP